MPTKPRPVEVARPDGSKHLVARDRYSEGQIRCMDNVIFGYGQKFTRRKQEERGITIVQLELPPGYAIHTHKNNEENGKIVVPENGDPYAGDILRLL